jgi:hypothetical protein
MAPEAWLELMKHRETVIAKEKGDPLRYGWEPPTWKLCDCIVEFRWVDTGLAREVQAALGFQHRVTTLMINGGNRGGKSEYGARRSWRQLLDGPEQYVWMMHENDRRSMEDQQRLMWKLMPEEIRPGKDTRRRNEYIVWKDQTGFAQGKFTLSNRSYCSFMTYNQAEPEGGMVHLIVADERCPASWIKTLELRVNDFAGTVLQPFTPVDGYSDSVKMFHDGAKTVMNSRAYLLPKDGMEPDKGAALGLDPKDFKTLLSELYKRDAGASSVRSSVPEDLIKRILDHELMISEFCGKRQFDTVPRVMKCADAEGKRAVVFFHSADNPHGKPLNVMETALGSGEEFIKERFYGFATRAQMQQFPLFSEDIHVVPDSAIPEKGDRYMICDPAGARNWCWIYILSCPDGDYVCGEFPSAIHLVPGYGVLGDWALVSTTKPDGEKGPAQKSLGWGLMQYKSHAAYLEGWSEATEGAMESMVEKWMDPSMYPGAKAKFMVRERFMDSRFGGAKHVGMDGATTTLEECADIGFHFSPTVSGGVKLSIQEGVGMINSALYFDRNKPLSVMNRPRLRIAESCKNTIFALRNWTGEGGTTGATKDFIDLLRYWFLLGFGYQKQEDVVSAGRGCY